MASKKGSQLPVASSVADNDPVILVTGTTPITKKAAKSVFLDGLATDAELAAGLANKADTSALTSHTGNTSNPHGVTESQVGLSDVDNIADSAKPVSTATQTALNAKQYKTFVTVGSADADYITDGTADQVQIQAAIDAVVAAGGGTIFVKAGTYSISSSIVVKSDIWMQWAIRQG
jgi:polygalacturonase